MGDQTKAEALRIAKESLDSRGWKYTSGEIGLYAAEIIIAMNAKLESKAG